MFHRVRSEVQDNKNSVTQSEEAEVTKAEITEMKTPQATLEIVQDEPEEAYEAEEMAQDVQEDDASASADETETYETETEEDLSEMTDNETYDEENAEAPATMNPYARSGPAPAAAAAGYPGASYPGFGSSNAGSSESDRRLTIGRGITMSGEIESCDYLLVEGTVEAALKGANMLEIAESGTFYGTVEIEEANIAGRFEGDIQVNGRLTISASGTVTGSISYKELEIEAGAVIDGKLTPLSAVPQAEAKPSAAKAKKPAPAKAKAAEKKPAPANTDEGLFSKATAAAE